MSARIRVVLVDDQPLFRHGVATVVAAQPDMEVVGEAGTGAEAVELLAGIDADVVLMDIRMPDMDGAEATRLLLSPQRAATRATPLRIIVLTTFGLDERARAAITVGASGFLLKDASPEFLCSAIRAVGSGTAVAAAGDLATLLGPGSTPVPPVPAAFATLSGKEREVFGAVAEGLSNAEIAARLFLSESTVKSHVSNVLAKLALRDRVQLVVFAHRYGLHSAGESSSQG
ncbi:response regulator transcription factor [Chryseoglobus sp. 28M-23]|uniref:response regulator n=1 Tax=Chryseoglobus sp. 28M-23 TaxID=2772253 RepID=UPI001746C800|nr:response regulator transcription factor [Chryseoglobus sp. 28M-23]QOD92739.1 response regulator transcription factor [Chryseoglobus sp. 28M-23]